MHSNVRRELAAKIALWPISRKSRGANRLNNSKTSSAPAVRALAEKHGVVAPICEAVAAVLADERDLDEAIEGLLSRPLRSEQEE